MTPDEKRKMAQAKKAIAEMKAMLRARNAYALFPDSLKKAMVEERELGRELDRRRDVAFYLKIAATRAEQDAEKVAKKWKRASDRVQRMLEARRKKGSAL